LPGNRSQDGRYRRIEAFIDVEEALSQLIPRITVDRKVVGKRTRQAMWHVLAEDIYALRDSPPLHMSHVDGFAARSDDLQRASQDAPVSLIVLGSIGPGESGLKLPQGYVYRIHTGGYLPLGADTVIPQEDVRTDGSKILASRPYSALENVVPAGSDVRRGELVARSGEVLMPAKASLLESLGKYEVKVCAPLRVSVLSFGDELTDDPAEAGRGKVLNTHAALISEMLRGLCCEPVKMQIVPDRREAVHDSLSAAIGESDLVITIGGSSVGDIDLVGAEMRRMAEVFLQGLKLQPGRVGGAAVIEGKPVIMLPGLIHSTVNVFNYLAAPIIAHMLQMSLEQLILRIEAVMGERVEFYRWLDFRRIVWVTLKKVLGLGFVAKPNVADASNISSISFSHGYVEVPPHKAVVEVGEKVTVSVPLWMNRGAIIVAGS